MTPDPTQPYEPVDALDSDSPRPGAARRGLVTAAIAVLALAAAGATGAALASGGTGSEQTGLAAATGSASPSPDPSGKADDRGRHKAFGGRPGMHGRGHPLGAGGALHGELVVPDGSGGYRTVVVQHGTASRVSDTSITVRSDDGFTQTYAITADTAVGADREGAAGIDKGAEVAVMGEKKGSAVTALHVADLAAWGGPGHGMGAGMGGFGPDDDADGDRPAPSPTGTAEGSSAGV